MLIRVGRSEAQSLRPPISTTPAPGLQVPSSAPTFLSVAQSPEPSIPTGTPDSIPVTAVAGAAPANAAAGVEEMVALLKQIDALRKEQQLALEAPAQQDAQTKKQFELQQKQIEALEKMVRLLADQLKQQPVGPEFAKLQAQAAALESRARQAAQRDVELAHAIDGLVEQRDIDQRYGYPLPSQLKELFFPSGTNESPLSIYGTLVAGYRLFPSERGEGHFFFDGFEPIFLLQLNDHILLETELEFHLDGVEVGYAQMDYIVNDWLTFVAGRYLTPIGFFNERLHPAWINKLPDFPLMMLQTTFADSSLNGIQIRGGKFLFCSPVKLEYSLFVANGFGVPGAGALTDLADIGAVKDTSKDVNDAIAFGGRIGLVIPKLGFWGGVSTLINRPYGEDKGNDINVFDIDLNYHKGNWDFRLEYAQTFQETTAFLDNNIRRRGFYAQLAYRPLDCTNHILRNIEYVARYSFARFKGIDPNALDLTAFETPVSAPVDRNQYTFGINIYPYPSLVFKFAYEINQEIHGVDLRDNVFFAQVAWGF
jgi:hypothetical protein